MRASAWVQLPGMPRVYVGQEAAPRYPANPVPPADRQPVPGAAVPPPVLVEPELPSWQVFTGGLALGLMIGRFLLGK